MEEKQQIKNKKCDKLNKSQMKDDEGWIVQFAKNVYHHELAIAKRVDR